MATLRWKSKAGLSQMVDGHPAALTGRHLPLCDADGLRKGVRTTPAGTQDNAPDNRLKPVTMLTRGHGLGA